jgi:hypothetical protein
MSALTCEQAGIVVGSEWVDTDDGCDTLTIVAVDEGARPRLLGRWRDRTPWAGDVQVIVDDFRPIDPIAYIERIRAVALREGAEIERARRLLLHDGVIP